MWAKHRGVHVVRILDLESSFQQFGYVLWLSLFLQGNFSLMKPIKIAAVSYLNTIPFLYGFIYHARLSKQIEVEKAIPSRVATMLLKKEVDIALLPVAVLPELPEYHIISDYCIGTKGAVATVQLFSNEKIDHIHTVILDYQSRTSVMLTKILMKEHFKKEVNYKKAKPGYERQVESGEAALIIGDRATYALKNFKYHYDLGEIWNLKYQMPFAFAVWVSLRELDEEFLEDFNEALKQGLLERDRIVNQFAYLNNTKFNVQDYLYNKLDFEWNIDKQRAMTFFLSKIEEYKEEFAQESKEVLVQEDLEEVADEKNE